MSKIIDNSLTAPRGMQNTSCVWEGSTNFGRLTPIHFEELNPTDKITHFKPQVDMQLLSIASPTFGKIDMYLHCFFVPTRLIFSDFDQLISKQGAGKNATPPFCTLHGFASAYAGLDSGMQRAMFNHLTSLGLPPFFCSTSYVSALDEKNQRKLSVLPLRVYRQIWWDFYRDSELLRDESKGQYLDSGNGNRRASSQFLDSLTPENRCMSDTWLADLFTENGQSQLMPVDLGINVNQGLMLDPEDSISNDNLQTSSINGEPQEVHVFNGIGDGNPYIGEFSSVDFRKMEALNRLSERLSLSDKRVINQLYAKYGVKPLWEKMNMCQYVGGTKQEVFVRDIISTADTAETASAQTGLIGSPLGAKAGAGNCVLLNFDLDFVAQEHGYFMCILSVMPRVHFVQGFNRIWEKNVPEDWFTKPLERSGQVAVSKKEVAALYQTDTEYSETALLYDRDEDEDVFGYDQPYYWLKRGHDILAGDFLRYHTIDVTSGELSDIDLRDIRYMQSMSMFIDYPLDRKYSFKNMLLHPLPFNKIFSYLGGDIYSDADDHFHIHVNKFIEKNTIMDGFAVPTIETTEEPHQAKQVLPKVANL